MSMTKAALMPEGRIDVRVEDFLNDKLQTSSDLDSIDALLEDVKTQQALLRQQVDYASRISSASFLLTHAQLQEARENLDESTKAATAHSEDLRRQCKKFKSQQSDIDRRLLIVTRSETSDDAVAKFDESMQSLRKLEVAQGYMGLLSEVEDLSSQARRNFSASPKAALEPYLKLQNLHNALRKAQPAAEDAAPHLVDHVENTVRTLWKQMKDAFGKDFEKTLKRMKWPDKDIALAGPLEQEWADGVNKLLELQEPELKARDNQGADSRGQEEPLVLLPLDIMAKPLEMRFKYHFEGDRPTNRLDKPEYFLSHIVGLLNTYDEFFAIYIQPILQDHFRRSNLALTSIYVDSTSAFITSLIPMVRRKVFDILAEVSNQPQLLSHLIHELMSFDVSLRDEWNYDGGYAVEGWKGLTWEVLAKKEWFGRWLDVEKNFALSRYQNIIDTPDSGEIDYDSVGQGATKPIYAAVRVNDLLETITDRYKPLTSFSQKLRFLIDIQITIFDKFHSRLNDSLEAYLTNTSSIARTVSGVSREAQAELQGLGGLERLTRVYGSAEYLEKKMRDWSDDIFFLELWDELQDRARSNVGKKPLAGPMTVEAVAERTSSTVGSEADTGALFDETAGAYKRLRIRSEGFMQEMLIHSLRETLRPYSRINPWSSLSTEPSASLALTAELDATVQQLDEYLSFLAKALAQAPLRRIVRQVTLAMQTFLWDRVLMQYTFSTGGIAQFQRDVDAIWETVDRWLGEGQGEIGMRRMKEGLVLLSLPAKNDEGKEAEEEIGLDLWDVEKRVFRSNESGREVLDELGLEVLSESDARHVLERRIELGN